MKLMIFKPDGGAIHHSYIKGIVETAEGKLVLLHSDQKERYYNPGEWSAFKGEKEILSQEDAEILLAKLEKA